MFQDRVTAATTGVLIAVTALAWWSLLLGSKNMPMMTPWSYLAAWTVMMAAMMLPSALPMIALYARASSSRSTGPRSSIGVASFTLAYMVVWSSIGIPAYFAGALIERLAMAGDGFAAALPYALAVTLIAAGAYQFSSLKYRCLLVCRNPLSFLLGHWRPGYWGTVRVALDHAAYCAGCCGALMLVLVTAGAMSLPWVLSIAVIIFIEKLTPFGVRVAHVSGAALVALGVGVALTPSLVPILRA